MTRLTPSATPLDDEIPAATPAAADFICWLWAAIPASPRTGSIHVSRVAQALEVSDTTVRRWIKAAVAEPKQPLRPDVMRTLLMRANLRGHGDFLWPPLGERERAAQLRAGNAEKNLRILVDHPENVPDAWRDAGHLCTFRVWLYYHPRARVFGITSGSTNDMYSKVRRGGADLYDVVEVPSRWHAEVLKADVLNLVGAARCLPPREMVPVGRTETWHRRAGDVDLAAVASARRQDIGATPAPTERSN